MSIVTGLVHQKTSLIATLFPGGEFSPGGETLQERPKLCCQLGTQPDHHHYCHDNDRDEGDDNDRDDDDDDEDQEGYNELTWHLWRVRQVNTGCTLW